MKQVLEAELQKRREQHLYRQRRVLQSPQGSEVRVDGQHCINFSSNDYLGLANHPRLAEAVEQSLATFGWGSGASHLINGHSELHHQLELVLARFTGRDRALLFSTGYMANLGAIAALVGKGDAVFEDRLNHASLLDGGLISGARFQRFQHNDLDDLARRLQKTDARRKLVVVDGVFSMDGDLAPLPELADLARTHDAWLMVDDAHGFGCLGANGAGTIEHFGLSQTDVPVMMGTLGKAMGCFGAFVAGSEALIETLIQRARPYIYTTAMPAAVAASTLASLQLLTEESWRREHLVSLVERFRRGAEDAGLPLMDSSTAIQPVVIGDSQVTLQVAAALESKGFLVGAIRPPTVPQGSARLRITLSAAHSEQQVDDLLLALTEACRPYREVSA